MPEYLRYGKHDLRVWALQFVLMCFIVFHGLGLFHRHAIEAEHNVCVACKVAEHQALAVPDASLAPLFALLILLCLILPWYSKAAPCLGFFNRPQPRGPPLSFIS